MLRIHRKALRCCLGCFRRNAQTFTVPTSTSSN